MKPYIMRLSSGRLSLEFRDDDRRALTAAIRDRFGRIEIEVSPVGSLCRFGGASFTFYDQWDEPCLTAESALADSILEILLHDLVPVGRERAQPSHVEQSIGA